MSPRIKCYFDLFRSNFLFFVNENDFYEYFRTCTFYSKMYKLHIIHLALERNGKLIKALKSNVDNCKIFEVVGTGDHLDAKS